MYLVIYTNMKKIVIIIIAVLLAIISYFVISNYWSFDIQTQNDIKIAWFGLLLGISFIRISYLSKKNPKKNKEIIRTILIFDLYILGNFFLKSEINLNWAEFAIFFIFLLLLILSSYIKHWIKSIIWLILWIWILFFLLKAVFPDFEIDPNEINLNQIQDKLIIQTTENQGSLDSNTAKLIIEKSKNIKTIDIKWNSQESINIDDIKKISFLSKSDKIQTKVFVSIWKDIIYLNPQSSINFKPSGEKTIISSDSINWKIWIYPSPTSDIIISWNNINQINPQNNEEIQKLKDNKSEIINQYGWFLIENQITRKISKSLLDISFYIFPSQYKNNLENYDSVIKLLWIEDVSSNYKDSQTWSWNTEEILNQVKKWYWKTYLKLF